MKKLRRNGTLLGLAVVLVALAAMAWLALTGRVDWLARLAKPRIETALRSGGIETDDLNISRLTLEGGRIEHAKVRTGAGIAEIHGLEVALGVGNLAAGRAGAVTIDRLEFSVAEDPKGFATGETPTGMALPFDSLEIREWLVSFPVENVLKHVSGKVRAVLETDDVVTFEGDFATDGGSGAFSGRYDSSVGRGIVRFAGVALKAAGTREWIDAVLSADPANAGSFDWDSAAADIEVEIESNQPGKVLTNLKVDHGSFERSGIRGAFADLTARIERSSKGALLIEADATGVGAQSKDWSASAETLQVIGNPGAANIALGNAVVTSGGREARGHGLGSVALDESWTPASAEGTLILDSATFDGIYAGTAEIPLRWQPGALSVQTAGLTITGRVAAVVEEFEMQATGLGGSEPGVNGKMAITVDTDILAGAGLAITPARERITASFLGSLAEGRESLRVEFKADSAVRTFAATGFKGGATGGLSGVVSLDASHVSGSVTGIWKDVVVAQLPEDRVASFPEITFKWTLGRTWLESMEAWGGYEPSRTLRELLWVSNIDVSAENGAVILPGIGSADGVAVRVLSNGVDLSEGAGGSLVVSAKSLETGDRRLVNLGGVLAFGLDGGTAVVDLELNRPRIPVQSRQTISWSDGLSMQGAFSTGVFDLPVDGSLDGLSMALEGITASGKASVRGNLTLGPGGLDGDARIELDSVGMEWPAKKAVLEGISGVIELDSLAQLSARPGQKVTFEKGSLSKIDFTSGTVEFGMPSPALVEITRLDAGTLGGSVSAAAFSFDPMDPKPSTKIRLDGVQLEQLMEFVQDVPATAKGPIVGEIPVSWDGTKIAFGNGFIDLKPGELGRVWFDYDVRMLTSGRRPSNQMYPFLRRVEKAILDLHFNRLRIDLYPPDFPGRTMQIRIAGVTATSDVVAPVALDVNINAPLDRFINWGGNSVKP